MGDKKSFNEFDAKANEESVVSSTRNTPRSHTTSRSGAMALRVAAGVVVFAAVCAIAWPAFTWWAIALGAIFGACTFMSVHVVLDWERVVVLRFGSFNRASGPGLVLTIPFVEYVASVVDMRMRSTAFGAEKALTSDLVPVDVDAVLLWTVWDAKRACTEIENFERSVFLAAQTALRDAIGSMNVAQMGTRRQQLDKQISDFLESKTNEWGISVVSVDIRDIEVPEELQESLSAEARAEREYNARVLLAEVENEISDMYVDAARKYKGEEGALQLRAMGMVANSVKEKDGIFVIPSALSEAFKNLGSLKGD